MFKRDLKKAYRQIPIDPGEVHLLGYCFHGHLYCDRVLPMGLRSACQACQRVTNAVAFAFSKMGFSLVNYIDDLAGAEVPCRADEGYSKLGALLHDVGLAESHDKACPPSTNMTFLGIDFDSIAGTLTIPKDKLDEVKNALGVWLNKDKASRKEVQSLIGSLNFLASCVRPGRVFLSRILNFLRDMKGEGDCTLTADFKQDVRWWNIYAPLYNGVSLMPLSDWSEPDAIVSCDACLVGAGGWFDGQFFHSKFPQFIQSQKLHINALELLTLVVALKLWGCNHKGCRMKLFCDNEVSVVVVNTGRSRDPFLQACLREICFLASVHEFEVKAVHLPGVSNRLPDLLSRWDLAKRFQEEFHQLTKDIITTEFIVDDDMFRFSHKW